MNLAKVSSNGKITVPLEIRRKLKIKGGDKILFLEKKTGEIIIQNSSIIALQEAQIAFEDAQISEHDVLNEVMNIRYGKDIQPCG